MGSKISGLIEVNSEISNRDSSSSYVDFLIPDDLLIDILSFVPASDLIKNCSLVCKDWKNIIDGQSVWKLKCKRERKNIPLIKLQKIPTHFFRKIFIHNPYGRNLIQNPCGEDGMAGWTMLRTRGDGFAVENPPAGADPVPQQVGSQSCFATSYYPCTKYQVIDLCANGIPKEILQAETTKIEIGEWFCARFDCASQYQMFVVLLDENFREGPRLHQGLLEEHRVDSFHHEFREEQWSGREWHSVSYTFENVGKARYVYFGHEGKDSQFWAGHFGSKMTGAFVKVLP